jgi:hypothetical protein
MQGNPKVTNIALNPLGGAATLIVGTILASKVQVMEDPAFNGGAPQGLSGYYLDPAVYPPNPPSPSPANLQVWLPAGTGGLGAAYQPITFGGQDGRVHGGQGDYVSAQGTRLLLLTTNSANAGGVLLVEWP